MSSMVINKNRELLEARLADSQARSDFVDQYVDALIESWHKHPETAPQTCRPTVYADDEEMAADELGLSMRDYVNKTMR